MKHGKRLIWPAGMARRHLVDHDRHSGKSIRMIASEPLCHAATIAIAQHIKAR
jgi:hypothetical protein